MSSERDRDRSARRPDPYWGALRYQIAGVCAWRAGKDQAFKWLERAYMQRDPGLALWVKWEPTLGRADSRHKPLLHKMKLAE